jgi:hypothetical protein
MGAYFGGRSTPSVAAEPFRVTVNTQRRRLILHDHQHLLQRKKHVVLPQSTFDLFLKPVPETECKEEEENNCHFDGYPRKKCFEKTITQFLEPIRKLGNPPTKKRKKERALHYVERFTQETPKNIQISTNASDTKEESSKDTLCLFMNIL